MRVGLIASSSYVTSGLSAEFGSLPPCLLPLGGRRLIHHQIDIMHSLVDQIFVSLPDDFDLTPQDRKEIEDRDVIIIPSDPCLSIGEAIANCINCIEIKFEQLVVLYGDTLIEGLENLPEDAYSAHPANSQYRWADAHTFAASQGTLGKNIVLSGLFAFSDVPLLLRMIVNAEGAFLDALNSYAIHCPMTSNSDGEWYDFGHVQTYFRSSQLISTARDFNCLEIDSKSVAKASEDRTKMLAEAAWMDGLPPSMRAYVPAFLGSFEKDGMTGYRTSNTHLATLSSLAVFGQLNVDVWLRIFSASRDFLDDALGIKAPAGMTLSADGYYGAKTRARLESYAANAPVSVDKPLRVNGVLVPAPMEMCEIAGTLIANTPMPAPVLTHGDYCFSNIFFDFRADSIKLIDPRGLLPGGQQSLFGDPRYDIAKFSHSALGGYDLIVAGRMPVQLIDGALTLDTSAMSAPPWLAMQCAFNESALAERVGSRSVLIAMLVHLFLSMLPLHQDRPDRQLGFLATAALLFKSLEPL